MFKKEYIKYIIGMWSIAIGIYLLLALFFSMLSWGWFGAMPTFKELENPESSLASELYSHDGVLLGKFYVENRSNTEFSNLSPHLVNALCATEDARFYRHSGIDFLSFFRVVYGVVTGNNKGGGSTITQQLAKNLFPRGERLSKSQLVLRKFKEWVTAVKLEKKYSKNEILAMYLNTVPFGSQSFGIKSACQTFFNRTPMELKVEEAALLIGVVNAPTRYSPVLNPESSMYRRNVVLSQMAKYNYLPQTTADSLMLEPIDMSRYNVMSHNTGIAKYFREYIRAKLRAWTKTHMKANGEPYDLYKDGLKIYTTIDSRMQKHAEAAVAEYLGRELQPSFDRHWEGHEHAPFVFPEDNIEEEIEKIMALSIKRSERYLKMKRNGIAEEDILKTFYIERPMRVFSWNGDLDTVMTPYDSIAYYKKFLHAGLMSVDPYTGQVRAYVGGVNYDHFKYDHVCYGKRQVGSTFKPFLYTLAMQEGEHTPCTKVANVQTRIQLSDGTYWIPMNASNDKIGEMVTLKWALTHSNNWISAYLINRYSPANVKKIARKMGVVSPIPEVPAIALGTPDISLYEMVGAMNTFVNKGIYLEPYFITRIEDKNGNIIEHFVSKQQEAMSSYTANLMIEMLKGVVDAGTGIRLRYRYGLNMPIAGKTGTTQNQSDGWFIGMVPELTSGVWVGAEDRSAHFRSISLGQGANTALPIWAIYMKKLFSDSSFSFSKADFEQPEGFDPAIFDCDAVQEKSFRIQNQINEDEF